MTADRASYVAGLRALADLLEDNEHLPLPFEGSQSNLSFFTSNREQLQSLARLMGRAEKDYTDNPVYGFKLRGELFGLDVIAYGNREQVCTSVVKGVREVTREVPDPDALAAVPTVTVTETVEDVEWICEPLLAEAPAAVAS